MNFKDDIVVYHHCCCSTSQTKPSFLSDYRIYQCNKNNDNLEVQNAISSFQRGILFCCILVFVYPTSVDIYFQLTAYFVPTREEAPFELELISFYFHIYFYL